MNSSLEARDHEIRSEADRLLASGLLEILEEFGDVYIVGSYTLHLMAWRDLDIHLVQQTLDRKSFFELGRQIAELLRPTRMHYRDETISATPGLPRGFYWGIYLGDERRGAWKIDIWVTEPEVFESIRDYGQQIGAELSESTRRAILEIKSACWQHPGYRRQFSSGDIYQAVLDHGVVDVDGFWAFLRARGRSF